MGKNKTGSIYYSKKDKRWRCSYYLNDQRKTKSFQTEKEAKDFLTSIQFQKGSDLFIKNNGIPLNKLMKEIAQKKLDMNIIGERTYVRILETIRVIEKSPIAEKNIDNIESNDIQEYLNTLKDYSNSTIKKIKEQFSQAFRESVNRGYITRNPMNNVIRPKSNQNRVMVRALEIEEQQKLSDYLINVPISIEPYKVAYLMEMYMGLRSGEALALSTSDINLPKHSIFISKTLTINKDYEIIMKNFPKTFSGIREIPIPDFLMNDIIVQMEMAKNNKDNLLFVNSEGDYVRPGNANRRFKQILKELGIKGITLHSLRHTFATRAIEAGMRAVTLQRIMGHSDVAITLNTYTSVFNKYKEMELEKVNNYYMNNNIVANNNLLNENIKLLDDKEKSKEDEER